MFKPKAHQIESARFLLTYDRCACLDDMGTGKTSSTMMAVSYLLLNDQVKTCLVLSTKSGVDSAWVGDLNKFFPTVPYTVLEGKAESRLGQWKSRHGLVISNHAFLDMVWIPPIKAVKDDQGKVVTPAVKEILHKPQQLDLIVIDEATILSNSSSRKYKAIQKLLKAFPKCKLWLLTGTPMGNKPMNSYGLIKLINPKAQSLTKTVWTELTMNHIKDFVYEPKKDAPKIVERWLTPAIRHNIVSCADMPEINTIRVNHKLSKQQKDLLEAMLEDNYIQLESQEITALNAGARLAKAMQIASGSVNTDTKEVMYLDCKPKLEALKDIIDGSSCPVIVFSPFTNNCLWLRSELAKEYGSSVSLIHGDTTSVNRQAIVRLFQAGEIPILVGNPFAMSHALTLTRSHCIVWWVPIFNGEIYTQANRRIYRIGQENKCLIYQLCGSAVEAKFYKSLHTKATLESILLELIRERKIAV